MISITEKYEMDSDRKITFQFAIWFFKFFPDVLTEAVYLSVDPYMRPYTERIPVGVTMIGSQVAKYDSKSSHVL